MICLGFVAALQAGACSDDVQPCEEGTLEVGGLQCCANGCGLNTEGGLPRICRNEKYVCEGSAPVLEDACASREQACTPIPGCTMGREEGDPAPELCCDGGCNGTLALHRVCKTGTLWECPPGAVPVSRCKDYKNACGGILKAYRDNNHKLP